MFDLQRVMDGIAWRVEVCRDTLNSSFRKGMAARVGPFVCPVCGKRTWRFDPLPSYFLNMYKKYGRDLHNMVGETCNLGAYQCPDCQASDRARLYALYLETWFRDIEQGVKKTFVDFAPSSSLTQCILGKIRDNGADIHYVTADLMKKGVDIKADIADMPVFADRSVDYFICSHVLEHVPNDQRALGELFRILKPGGEGILMVPIDLKAEKIDEDPTVTDVGERWRRFGQDDHVRIYSKNGFLERVRAAGFIVTEYGASHFGRFVFWRHGISQNSILYVVQRP